MGLNKDMKKLNGSTSPKDWTLRWHRTLPNGWRYGKIIDNESRWSRIRAWVTKWFRRGLL